MSNRENQEDNLVKLRKLIQEGIDSSDPSLLTPKKANGMDVSF
jgi:hypothetical protein